MGGGETTRASTLLEVGVGRPGLRCLLVRPGNSLTVTDTGGTPVRDLPLSEELTRQQREIPLVNPVSIAREEEGEQMDNIRVLSVQDQTVLLWSKVSLHLVSLLTGSVVASYRSLRNILDLAVTSSGEILVLETPRLLRRRLPASAIIDVQPFKSVMTNFSHTAFSISVCYNINE